MMRSILIALFLLAIATPALAKHPPKHALLVKHSITVHATIHIPAGAYHRAIQKQRHK